MAERTPDFYSADGSPAFLSRSRGQDSLVSQAGRPLITGGPASANLNRGGPINLLSGLGGRKDKGDSTQWLPSWQLTSQQAMETLYIQSWAAAKFIDAPVDDMLIMGREYEDEDEEAVTKVEEAEAELKVADRVSKAMKAARLHGTGLLIMMSKEALPDEPLQMERVREGDLTNLLVFNRFEVSIHTEVVDPWDNHYGEPELYMITPSIGPNEPILVHHTRVIRFDGKKSLSSDGWRGTYERHWGVSELASAITEIAHDAGMMGAIAHLVHEASIAVVKTQNYKEALKGEPSDDEPTITELALAMDMSKSVWNTMFMDVNDEFERVNVSFGGIAELVNMIGLRLAAMAGIPATRFMGQSPVGMNATGDSDMMNYSIFIAALQKRMLGPTLKPLDTFLARHVGLKEPLKYEWRPLMDLSEQDKATVSKTKAEALALVYDRSAMDEPEIRDRLEGDPLFGHFEDMPEILNEKIDLELHPPEPEIPPGDNPPPGE